jgi:hypothetical protein
VVGAIATQVMGQDGIPASISSIRRMVSRRATTTF